ncbi:Sodium/calcium exchanger protein-domain-containing protein [Umbelopsis sp. PMI_123]|nr:Sodium/calcium exchanger protein-domain-containing protein [Umbelopsis sp. PMI_123]
MTLPPRIISLMLLMSCVHALKTPNDSNPPIPCEHIYNHPDQCSFVQQNCKEYSTGILDYLCLYYCSGPYKPLILIALFAFLTYLFAAIGVVASDFFCPNLQTIASSLHMSESLAGVTFLAFGNASPDLFTTFSALNSGSGSLAVGELIGAAFFIVTVVAGGMALIHPFRAKRMVFLRDVTFFTGAVAVVGWIVYDQKIYLTEAAGLIFYYILYVAVVVGSTWWKNKQEEDRNEEEEEEEEAREHPGHLGHILRPVSPKMMRRISLRIDTNNLPVSDGLYAPTASKSYRPPLTPRIGIRPSIFGAIEFHNALTAAQHASMQLKHDAIENRHQRNQSMPSYMSKMSRHHHRRVLGYLANTKYVKKIRFWWHLFEKNHQAYSEFLSEVWRTLFPTLQNWQTKSISNIGSSILAIPIVFLLRITLPVVEDDGLRVDDMIIPLEGDDGQSSDTIDASANEYTEEYDDADGIFQQSPFEETVDQRWLKWHVILQCICAPTFVAFSLWVNGFIALHEVLGGFMVGMCLALMIAVSTKSNTAPPWIKSLAFAGFVVSLVWIYAVANEVVGLLQAIGLILDISGAILGLTVFAMGNSLGDLVANMSMAKMGLPNMAMSACYAGPLLNLVLGLGIAASYRVWVTGEIYELELAPTIIVSSIGLLLVLVTAIVVTYLNNYRIDKWIGIMWISIYFIATSLSIFMEVSEE